MDLKENIKFIEYNMTQFEFDTGTKKIDENIVVKIESGIAKHKTEKRNYLSVIKINMEGSGKESEFKLSATINGVFEIDEDIANISEEEESIILEIAYSTLYPYLRTIISNTMNNFNIKPIKLPL